MSLFKKKDKDMTIQDCEQEFNRLQFKIGQTTYLIDLKTQELNMLNDDLNKDLQTMQKLAHRGSLLTKKAKNELDETIKKGEKSESPLN